MKGKLLKILFPLRLMFLIYFMLFDLAYYLITGISGIERSQTAIYYIICLPYCFLILFYQLRRNKIFEKDEKEINRRRKGINQKSF